MKNIIHHTTTKLIFIRERNRKDMKLFPLDLTTNTDELKRLIAENPELPIVVLAGENATDGEQTMFCSDVKFWIQDLLDCEVPYMECVETDKSNFEEQIEEWLWDEMGGNDKDSKLSEAVFEDALKETKAKYEPYWKKVIAIKGNN